MFSYPAEPEIALPNLDTPHKGDPTTKHLTQKAFFTHILPVGQILCSLTQGHQRTPPAETPSFSSSSIRTQDKPSRPK